MTGSVSADSVRVLLVSALPPPPGGVETWTQVLCERGLPAPFELEFVDTKAFRRGRDAGPSLSLTEAKRNIRILRQVRRSLTSGRVSVMHLNCALTLTGAPRNLATALIARRAGVPYVVHLRGTFSVPPGGRPAARFYRWAYRMIFEGAARVLALGQPSYRAVLELGDFAHKTRALLPNFVDFRAVPERVPDTERRESLRVIYTGALIEAKGIHTIVEVATRLPGARFQLVGGASPESRAELVRRIRERGLDDRVEALEPVTNREVLGMLAEADVFLFPSQFGFEGFPCSVAEAMAVGLPVVASSVGAIPEMVDVPEGGFLAAADDVGAYVRMLERLRDEPSLRDRMGRHNRQKALREYDYDVVVPQLCGIYSQVALRIGDDQSADGD